MAYTQDDKLISITTSLGKDVLLLTEISGEEAVSRSFRFELALVSEKQTIHHDAIIGRNATVTIALSDGGKRYFNGIVSSFSQGRGGGDGGEDARFSYYRCTMVPWFWSLSKCAGTKIFQNLSIPGIVEQVFKDRGCSDYRFDLRGCYEKREFCVQYRETDFNFVSRLLEEEGIFYFFQHEKGKHTMVLADSPEANATCPSRQAVSCLASASGTHENEVITALEITRQMRPSKYSLNDFNFKIPKTSLKVEVPGAARSKAGECDVYDAPAGFDTRAAGCRLARMRMEEEEAQSVVISGSSDCRSFTSGYRFTLADHSNPDLNGKDFLLVSVRHDAIEGYGTDAISNYQNSFHCIPFHTPYRPPRLTPKPVVQGTQTAIVVGPPGEEIHTDEHGRVKVQFHWDRDGKHDDNSSCWIRVSQLWVGNGWGCFHLPRVGQEVLVDFLEGDPDRPIIIGQLHNGVNRPPYPLPAQRSMSGIKSSSTPGGEGSNEVRFEDRKGEEEVFIHAERQQVNRVEEDSREWVGQDRHVEVGRDRFETVSRDQRLTVRGAVTVTVGADFRQQVAGRHTLQAGQEIRLAAGGELVLEAGARITMQVGGSRIIIDPGGITLIGNISRGGLSASAPKAIEEPSQV